MEVILGVLSQGLIALLYEPASRYAPLFRCNLEVAHFPGQLVKLENLGHVLLGEPARAINQPHPDGTLLGFLDHGEFELFQDALLLVVRKFTPFLEFDFVFHGV